MQELTWNEYIDLVKAECERRFEHGERYTVYTVGLSMRGIDKVHCHRLMSITGGNDFPYTESHFRTRKDIHLQPRLDWLESLKE